MEPPWGTQQWTRAQLIMKRRDGGVEELPRKTERMIYPRKARSLSPSICIFQLPGQAGSPGCYTEVTTQVAPASMLTSGVEDAPVVKIPGFGRGTITGTKWMPEQKCSSGSRIMRPLGITKQCMWSHRKGKIEVKTLETKEHLLLQPYPDSGSTSPTRKALARASFCWSLHLERTDSSKQGHRKAGGCG